MLCFVSSVCSIVWASINKSDSFWRGKTSNKYQTCSPCSIRVLERLWEISSFPPFPWHTKSWTTPKTYLMTHLHYAFYFMVAKRLKWSLLTLSTCTYFTSGKRLYHVSPWEAITTWPAWKHPYAVRKFILPTETSMFRPCQRTSLFEKG